MPASSGAVGIRRAPSTRLCIGLASTAISEITLDARPRWIAFDTGAGRNPGRHRSRRMSIQRRCHLRRRPRHPISLPAKGVEERLRINGGYGLAPEIGILDLDGIIDEGRFESPAMDEVFRLAIGEGFANGGEQEHPVASLTDDSRFPAAENEASASICAPSGSRSCRSRGIRTPEAAAGSWATAESSRRRRRRPDRPARTHGRTRDPLPLHVPHHRLRRAVDHR